MPNSILNDRALPVGFFIEERYQIIRVLGAGGFGITYLCAGAEDSTKYAVKELVPPTCVGHSPVGEMIFDETHDRELFDEDRHRFKQESEVAMSLKHPNIVQVQRYFESHGTSFIVMLYESGVTLKECMGSGAFQLDGPRFQSLFCPLLDALEIVHSAQFLHRDIKPSNIFLSRGEVPFLLDFGAVKRIGQSDHPGENTQVLTPHYAPLEQYARDGRLGPWTDIYGLAAVMYRCVAGVDPPTAPARNAGDSFEPAAQMRSSNLAQSCLTAIDSGLAMEIADRPQSVAEWRRQFDFGSPAEKKSEPARLRKKPPPPLDDELSAEERKALIASGRRVRTETSVEFAARCVFWLLLLATLGLLGAILMDQEWDWLPFK